MNRPLGELSITFVPLDFVTEWARCGQTADYLARFLAYDFENREAAASVFSTAINELVENAAKFSADKTQPARIVVRHDGDRVSIATRNNASAAQAASFRDVAADISAADPETLFAERLLHPPDVGGAGIGLIVLRKDYGAVVSVRTEAESAAQSTVEVEVTIAHEEIEQR